GVFPGIYRQSPAVTPSFSAAPSSSIPSAHLAKSPHRHEASKPCGCGGIDLMRRVPVIAAAIVLIAAVLTGCGGKSADSVVKDLDKTMSKLESYRGSGRMVLHTGQQPLEYKVD